jgi:hypothetical protein
MWLTQPLGALGRVFRAGRTRPEQSESRAAAENYTGAQLSEVLNTEVTSNDEGGFSRRRVVKGVAWSVPVIATAIAAPAAAASGIVASVVLGAAVPITLAGAASISGTSPTGFDVQTASTFKGPTVTYTITIDSVKENQKAVVEIGSVTLGTGTSSKGAKFSTLTGTLPTSAGAHALHVGLSGFKYSGTATKGSYTYAVTLTVTMDGVATVKTGTIQVTYP